MSILRVALVLILFFLHPAFSIPYGMLPQTLSSVIREEKQDYSPLIALGYQDIIRNLLEYGLHSRKKEGVPCKGPDIRFGDWLKASPSDYTLYVLGQLQVGNAIDNIGKYLNPRSTGKLIHLIAENKITLERIFSTLIEGAIPLEKSVRTNYNNTANKEEHIKRQAMLYEKEQFCFDLIERLIKLEEEISNLESRFLKENQDNLTVNLNNLDDIKEKIFLLKDDPSKEQIARLLETYMPLLDEKQQAKEMIRKLMGDQSEAFYNINLALLQQSLDPSTKIEASHKIEQKRRLWLAYIFSYALYQALMHEQASYPEFLIVKALNLLFLNNTDFYKDGRPDFHALLSEMKSIIAPHPEEEKISKEKQQLFSRAQKETNQEKRQELFTRLAQKTTELKKFSLEERLKSLPSVTPAFVKTLGHDLQRTIGNKNREQLILTAFLYDYYNNLLPPAITQNGNTRYANHQFTDCVESAIRTLFRFCTYNKKTKKFDPTFLQEKGLIQKVADFLKKETIDDTPQRHTDWASHVSNLNQISPDKPKIAYANATYELDGNLDNILKVISHFFPHDQNLIKLDQQIEKETHSLKKAELFKSKMDYVCSFLSREGFYLDWETNEKEKNLSYSIDTISHTEITVTAYSDEEKSRPITYFSWYLDKLHSEINRPYDQTLQRQANGLLNSENFSPWTIEVLKYFVPARTLEESLSKVSKSYPAEFIKFIFSMDIDEEETQDFISKSLQGLSSIPKTLIYFDRYFSYERYKSILPTTDHVLDFLENLVHPISLDLTEIQSMSDPQLDRLIEIIQDNDYRRNLKEILLPASVPAKTNISCIILKELANKEKTLSLPPESFSKDGFVKLRKYHSFFNIISLEDWENAPEDHLDWIMETFRESHFFDKFSFPRTSHEIQYSKIQKIILANQKKDLDQRTYLNVSSDIFYSDIWPNYSRLNIKTVEKLLKFFPFVKEWMIDELHYAQYYWNFSSGDLKKLLEQHSNVRIVWGLKDRYYHRVWSLGTQYNQPRVASFLDLEKELQREHYLTHINLTPSYLGFTLTPWQISELLPLIQKGVSLQSVELKLEDIGDLSPNSSILGPVFKLMNQGLIKKFSLTNSFFHMKHASSDIHHLLGKIANTVEELNLSGQVGIQPSDLEYFLKYKGFTSLQNLCFNYVALTPDVAKALAEFCQKTSNLKTLSWKGIDKDLWQDLYQYIIKIDNKYLTLEDVLFSDPSSKFLEKILTWSLESLDFSNQNLGDVSALKIAQIIKQRGEKNNLKEINLDNNALTAKGIEAFLETLAGSNITRVC